jgi:AAA family ATP:ADP antiporter
MIARLRKFISTQCDIYLQLDKYEKLKLLYLSISFFFIIGSYSILRSLKASIFLALVGKNYLPLAKIMGIILIIPIMIVYAKIIDNLKRYQVIFLFLILYAIFGFIFAGILSHSVYGVSNTLTSPYRITGWLFEILMDLYQALVVSTFWSYVNSVSTPSFARKSYGLIVASSRTGGVISTFIGYVILDCNFISGNYSIPLMIIFSSFLLFTAAYFIHKIAWNIPYEHLHGYEAAYQASKQRQSLGGLEGLKLIITQPYVFGIFWLVACFEMISIIFDYKMQVLMSIAHNNDIYNMSKFMFMYTGTFQVVSLFFALIGTTTLLKKMGVTPCLLIMPIATFMLILFLSCYPTLYTVFILMVILRALHYGFNSPIREILYIPTVKDIKFKSKAWIDSFGRTFSKSSGSTVNILTIVQQTVFGFSIETFATFSITFVWFFISLLIGKKYNTTILNNDVIGTNKTQD